MNTNDPESEPQLDKFKTLARELEADEDEARWDEQLKKVVAHKPAPEADLEKPGE